MKSVSSNNGAILVNPFIENDIIAAIFEIKDNPTKAKELIDFGKKNIKQYHVSNIVKKYYEVYDLINKRLS